MDNRNLMDLAVKLINGHGHDANADAELAAADLTDDDLRTLVIVMAGIAHNSMYGDSITHKPDEHEPADRLWSEQRKELHLRYERETQGGTNWNPEHGDPAGPPGTSIV